MCVLTWAKIVVDGKLEGWSISRGGMVWEIKYHFDIVVLRQTLARIHRLQ